MIANSVSDDRRKELQTNLSKSNVLLKKYYKQIAKSGGRKGFVDPNGENINRPKFYKQILELNKKNPNCNLSLHGINIPKEEVSEILNLEHLKLDVISSVSVMIKDLVSKKIKNGRLSDRSLSFDDLESEALKSVLYSLHSYTDSNICFSTYFYTCANRDINKLCSRSSPMSKISKKSLMLKKKYIETRKSIGRSASFDEIVSIMNIKEKDIDLLIKTLSSITISEDAADAASFSKYYSGLDGSRQYFSSGSSSKGLVLSSNNNFEESLSNRTIEEIDLSDLEKAVLEGFMKSSSKLGIGSIAKKLINPKTGKPFSRMAITYAWRRVKNKITQYKEAA